MGQGSGFRFQVILDGPNQLTAESPSYSWFAGIDVWHHVVGTYDAEEGRIAIYVDGVFQGEDFADPTWSRAQRDVWWGTDAAQAGKTRIGNGYDAGDKNFFGCTGGLALYGGVAVPATGTNPTKAPTDAQTNSSTDVTTARPTAVRYIRFFVLFSGRICLSFHRVKHSNMYTCLIKLLKLKTSPSTSALNVVSPYFARKIQMTYLRNFMQPRIEMMSYTITRCHFTSEILTFFNDINSHLSGHNSAANSHTNSTSNCITNPYRWPIYSDYSNNNHIYRCKLRQRWPR